MTTQVTLFVDNIKLEEDGYIKLPLHITSGLINLNIGDELHVYKVMEPISIDVHNAKAYEIVNDIKPSGS